MTALGRVSRARGGPAQWREAGDELFVTGPLGRAAAGLRRRRAGASLDDALVLAPSASLARLAEGMAARSGHATRDDRRLSDGLALDLHRLADASNVGFALVDIPVAEGATERRGDSAAARITSFLIATNDAARLRMIFVDRGLREPITHRDR